MPIYMKIMVGKFIY